MTADGSAPQNVQRDVQQQESTRESSSGAEDTSHKRGAEEMSEIEMSAAKKNRTSSRLTLQVARYTKVPANISSKLYELVCLGKYKE